MTTLLRRALPAVLIAFVLAACGATASPTPSASTPTSSAAPSSAASQPTASGPSDSGPVASAPAIDLEGAAAALEDIDSYKLTISIEGTTATTVEAVIVREPELAQHITSTAGTVTTEIIVIGDQAWVGTAGIFQSVPVATVGSLASAFDPALMLGQVTQPGMEQALQAVGEEERNGVQTTHYRIDENSPGSGLMSFPPGGVFDLWVAEEGYLVAMEATGLSDAMTSLKMDVTDINSPTNVVEAPE
jgi:hypothetical protein